MLRASRRQDPRESPFTASRSSSRTISMSPVCRRRLPVRPSPIAPIVRRSSSTGSSAPAQSSSARPTSISSRPGLWAYARPTAFRAMRCAPDLIPGGSSSGSATAVGAGLVPFSLGTDTAGSGRVPAALNGIVDLKPSLGALSTSGVVPACRTLDTVSIFARDVADAFIAFREAIAFDEQDPYSRPFREPALSAFPSGIRLGVPRPDQLQFFDDEDASAAFSQDVRLAQSLGARIVEFDFEPFAEVARMLYDGPWVAERYAAVKPLIETNPGGLPSGHPRDHRERAEVRRRCGLRGILSARRLGSGERAASGRNSTRWSFRRCRASIPSPRSRPIPCGSIPGSGPTPTSSTCSTFAQLRFPPAFVATGCHRASP